MVILIQENFSIRTIVEKTYFMYNGNSQYRIHHVSKEKVIA
jgi:hypothetical protein